MINTPPEPSMQELRTIALGGDKKSRNEQTCAIGVGSRA
jgi:hypothetical protein